MTEVAAYRSSFPNELDEFTRQGPSRVEEEHYDEGRQSITEVFDSRAIIGSLASIVVHWLVETYNGGPLDPSLTRLNRILFGSLLDVDLPIETVILLNNDTYWRRVVEKKTKYTHIRSRTAIPYKKLGLKLKFEELIEMTAPELWDLEYFTDLARKLRPYITALNINQLQSRSQLLLDKDMHVPNAEYRIRNYPIDECYHGDLSFLRKLRKLEHFSIEFVVLNLAFEYQKRHFDFAYKDIDILADAISQCSELSSFTVRRSLFTNRKIESLMRGLCDCSRLETLELSYCQLTSTAAIGTFLSANVSLKRLELRGNYLSGREVVELAVAINQYGGNLCYLGLSQNPLQSNGLKHILDNLRNTEQVNDLDVSACEFDADDVSYLLDFINSHEILDSVDLTSIQLSEANADKLIRIVRDNYRIVRLLHTFCGLSEEQELKVRVLLARNNYCLENRTFRRGNDLTMAEAREIDLLMGEKIKHHLMADKELPAFFRENRKKDEGYPIAADCAEYPQNACTESEFVDLVSFH